MTDALAQTAAENARPLAEQAGWRSLAPAPEPTPGRISPADPHGAA